MYTRLGEISVVWLNAASAIDRQLRPATAHPQAPCKSYDPILDKDNGERSPHGYVWHLLVLREAASQTACRPKNSHPCMQAMASQGSKYYCLQYKYVADIMEKRGPHRDAHLGAAKKKVCPPLLQCCMHHQQPAVVAQLSTDFSCSSSDFMQSDWGTRKKLANC